MDGLTLFWWNTCWHVSLSFLSSSLNHLVSSSFRHFQRLYWIVPQRFILQHKHKLLMSDWPCIERANVRLIWAKMEPSRYFKVCLLMNIFWDGELLTRIWQRENNLSKSGEPKSIGVCWPLSSQSPFIFFSIQIAWIFDRCNNHMLVCVCAAFFESGCTSAVCTLFASSNRCGRLVL